MAQRLNCLFANAIACIINRLNIYWNDYVITDLAEDLDVDSTNDWNKLYKLAKEKYGKDVDNNTILGYLLDSSNVYYRRNYSGRKSMSETLNQNRVRMNITTSAKGFAQMDITVEFPTVNESKEAMDSAIKALREVLKENNIAEAGTI